MTRNATRTSTPRTAVSISTSDAERNAHLDALYDYGASSASAYTAEMTMTRLRGALPPRPAMFARTPVVNRITGAVDLAMRSRAISLISGPVGVGKSTAVAEAGRDLNETVVYVLMQDAPSVKASLEVIWESMTQTPALGVEKQIKDDIQAYLLRHDLTLLIDDAHYVSTRGLRVLTNLWNAVHATRGKGISMVLVGNDLSTALKAVPEIQSRVVARYEVPPLAGDSLYAALAVIEPRTADTDRALLTQIDRQYFHGEMRQWVNFLEVIRMQHATPPATPIDAREIRIALMRQGWIQ